METSPLTSPVCPAKAALLKERLSDAEARELGIDELVNLSLCERGCSGPKQDEFYLGHGDYVVITTCPSKNTSD